MSQLNRGYTFGASETVTHTKLHNLVDDGTCTDIVNADIASNAAIVYSKLSLVDSITDADINSSAGILASKLDLRVPGAIGSTTPNTGAFSTLKVGTTNQGDILYDNGTSLVRLTPGTSGQVLKTNGSAANPSYTNSLASVLDYGTSGSSSTARQGTAIKVAFGTTSAITAGSSFSVSNLTFTSSSSYVVMASVADTNTGNGGNLDITYTSGSAFDITNQENVTHTVRWFAIGI
jgi:hypothetical protein